VCLVIDPTSHAVSKDSACLSKWTGSCLASNERATGISLFSTLALLRAYHPLLELRLVQIFVVITDGDRAN